MSDLAEWPTDLHIIFAAIGHAMADGRLNPEVLKRVPGGRDALIPGHAVHLRHLPKGVAARFVIELAGDRWEGAVWSFRSGHLEDLAKAALRSRG
jgi:hypothetical protein